MAPDDFKEQNKKMNLDGFHRLIECLEERLREKVGQFRSRPMEVDGDWLLENISYRGPFDFKVHLNSHGVVRVLPDEDYDDYCSREMLCGLAEKHGLPPDHLREEGPGYLIPHISTWRPNDNVYSTPHVDITVDYLRILNDEQARKNISGCFDEIIEQKEKIKRLAMEYNGE